MDNIRVIHKLWICYVDKYYWCVDNFFITGLVRMPKIERFKQASYHWITTWIIQMNGNTMLCSNAADTTLTILYQYFKLQKCEKYNLPLKKCFYMVFRCLHWGIVYITEQIFDCQKGSISSTHESTQKKPNCIKNPNNSKNHFDKSFDTAP